MTQKLARRCQECEGRDPGRQLFFSPDKGNGRCKRCDGTGHWRDLEAIINLVTIGFQDDKIPCEKCHGTGQCQNCGGTGYEYYDDDSIYEEQIDSGNEENSYYSSDTSEGYGYFDYSSPKPAKTSMDYSLKYGCSFSIFGGMIFGVLGFGSCTEKMHDITDIAKYNLFTGAIIGLIIGAVVGSVFGRIVFLFKKD